MPDLGNLGATFLFENSGAQFSVCLQVWKWPQGLDNRSSFSAFLGLCLLVRSKDSWSLQHYSPSCKEGCEDLAKKKSPCCFIGFLAFYLASPAAWQRAPFWASGIEKRRARTKVGVVWFARAL